MSSQPHALGRTVNHDPRSLAYAIAGLPTSSLKSVCWKRRAPIWDQKDLGSCTGNAAAGWLVTDNSSRQGLKVVNGQTIDELYAVGLYSQATRLDGIVGVYPPNDEGSSSLGVAKALRARKLISSYRHAFSLQATLTALQSGSVLLGVPWHGDSFEPDSEGIVPITGEVVGGHEVLADEIDVKRRLVGFSNSWGEWGRDGRAWFRWDDLGLLLDDQGDALQLSAEFGRGIAV